MTLENSGPFGCIFTRLTVAAFVPSLGLLLLFVGVAELRVEAEQVPALLHVRRQRRGHVERAAGGMGNDDAAGVQVELVLDAAGKIPGLLGGEIFRVADDRMADVGGVGAKLVGAAGDRAAW